MERGIEIACVVPGLPYKTETGRRLQTWQQAAFLKSPKSVRR